jgi:hypothetical protein
MIELLTVIAIMAILSVAMVMKPPSPGVSLDTAQRMAASMISSTRKCAITKGQRARLIINKDQTGNDRSKFLRYMGIVYESKQNSNNWIAADEGTMLPKNIFYIPSGLQDIKDLSKGDLAESDIADIMNIEYPKLSAQKESGPEWYYYEFSSKGLANGVNTANKRFVMYAGRTDADGIPIIDNEFAIAGFKIATNGSVIMITGRDDLD